jgi:hypothetical protein
MTPDAVRYIVNFAEIEHDGDLDDAKEMVREVGGKVVEAMVDYDMEEAVLLIEVPFPMTRQMLEEKLNTLGRCW